MLRSLLLLSFFALAACGPSAPGRPDGGDVDGGGTGTCELPDMFCGSRCVNVQTDARHCGGCGIECAAGSFCSMGECSRTCPSGLMACGASCVDIATDRDHCSGCDMPCAADEDCRGGSCTCPVGYIDCDGTCVDPESDPANCGVCGRSCGADETCSMGGCTCASTARETECDDGTDDDCDSLVDCDDDDCVGATRGCSGACGAGIETCEAGGAWGACEGGSGGAEICGDGIDQDCDGVDPRNPDSYEPNDSCDQCALLTSMTDPMITVNARFDSVSDNIDCYRFIADDGCCGREYITVDLTNIPEGHDYDVYLYQSYDACVANEPLVSGINNFNADEHLVWGERFAVGDSGTYYIRVRRFRGHSCEMNYQLRVDGLREMPGVTTP
jgi:hypothetical protein